MAFGDEIPLLVYWSDTGIIRPSSDGVFPEWVSLAAQEAEGEEDFARIMSTAGAVCTESYGMNEGLDLWRLPEKEGWVLFHFDPDGADFAIFVQDALSLAKFQVEVVAVLSRKIMEVDRYNLWRHQVEQKMKDGTLVH